MLLRELVGQLKASGGKVELGKKGPSDGVAESKAVKRVRGPRAGPFNRKKFKVRALVFSVRLNPGFFGPDRFSPWPDRASPRLTGWPRILFFFSFFFFTNYEKYIQF